MKQSETTPQAPPEVHPSPAWKKGLLVGAVVVGVFTLLNLGIWGMYHGRAYPGVKLGGQDVSNLDTAAVSSRVQEYTANYALVVEVRGQPQEVTNQSLGLSYEYQRSAKAAVNQGKNQWLPLYGLVYTWQKGSVGLSYQLDGDKLDQVAAGLAGTDSVAPTDAKVVIEGENIRVEDDKPGRGVDPKRLSALIQEQIARGQRRASIGERATEASITTKEIQAVLPAVQQAMKLPLSVQVSGRLYAPGAAQIGSWLVVSPDKDGRLVVGTNQDAINAYVAGVAGQVDVAAVIRQVNMVNGEVRTVSEGKNGSALDKDAIARALANAVATGKDTAVTGVMAAVAFKTRTNNSVDVEGKYIEINLSRQRLWAYNDKQLVYETPITSGATGAGHATIQGLFSIKAKQTNRNLNGVPLGFDYNVFVNYWMPFSGNYGMHDASWRNSFGGQDYYYGGSHGCVNMPASAAAWVFNFVNVGTPVWVHS